MTKLSELLETSALCISSMADDHRIRKISGSGEQRLLTRERALRSIAPALVRAVADVCECHRNEDGESLHPVNGCAVCALAITLEEAGVTCE